jgi:hypothetical protein
MKTISVFRISAFIVFISSLFFLGCSKEQRDALKDMMKLRDDIKAQYQAQDAGIMLMNGTVLKVTLINSPSNSLEYDGQKAKAKEIAKYAMARFSQISLVHQIVIAFVESKTFFFFFHANTGISFAFKIDELKSEP